MLLTVRPLEGRLILPDRSAAEEKGRPGLCLSQITPARDVLKFEGTEGNGAPLRVPQAVPNPLIRLGLRALTVNSVGALIVGGRYCQLWVDSPPGALPWVLS